MHQPPIQWLLEGEPWIEYRARVDLLNQAESEAQVRAARRAMLVSQQVESLVAELGDWPGTVIASHKSAGQPFHKLTFVADLGLKAGDPGVDAITARILKRQSPEGPFQLPMNIPTQYGGSGKDQWAWALCDAPLVVYALVKFGLDGNMQVQAAVQHLASLARENGWPCAVSRELGKFRGPGRKDDPCPFANLAMLKLLAVMPEWRDSPQARAGAAALLSLWEESLRRHPYMFFMGNDFRKLKAPLVWYDILHVLDVLAQFTWLGEDARLQNMLNFVKAKADPEGRYVPESIWTAWKGWEFGQKRDPSRWLTLLVWRVIARVENK